MTTPNEYFREANPRAMDCISLFCREGERYLSRGQYVLAQRWLRRAEAQAWRRRDGIALSNIYLPLMEAFRLLRQQACDGTIVISTGDDCLLRRGIVRDFLRQRAGTLLLGGRADQANHRWIVKVVARVGYAAQKSGRALEALPLLRCGDCWRIVPAADPMFAAGLPVQWAQDTSDQVVGDLAQADKIVLPGAGVYSPGSAGARLAGESVLAAHELLALKWQARHPVRAVRWAEMAWLRQALRIDPACEPVLMRLLALARAR